MKLRRILIPRKNPAVSNQQDYEKRALQVAKDLRERAAKGEDFERLQKEGYTTLGLTSPPGTDMGIRRRANLLPEEGDEILALNAGAVSKVEEETFSFVIYKVESKVLLAKDSVKDEISREISRQRLENALKEITTGVVPEFSQDYFPPGPSLPAKPPDSSTAGSQQPSSRAPR
jgi:parvulin-like peptidyl-prolyl isomerase